MNGILSSFSFRYLSVIGEQTSDKIDYFPPFENFDAENLLIHEDVVLYAMVHDRLIDFMENLTIFWVVSQLAAWLSS